jgi:peptide/nickel transport system ATP-binding protein
MSDPLLSVEGLEKHYPITEGFLNTEVGRARAVDGISFEVAAGETFGIVGESGCGKSTAATSMLRLEEPTSGDVRYQGESILEYDESELRRFRRDAQMIFQDPDSSFNPRMNIGTAVAEPLIVQGMTDRERRQEIVGDLLERVGLSADDMERYPHEFSGGQKQRIGLARALAVNPKLLVADEPVSALDVSIQSEILRLLKGFQRELELAVIIISHDLGVVREVCDRVAVMYLGEFVEVAPTEELFSNPQHPYTRALLSSIPTPDPTDRGLGVDLTGDVPDPSDPPSGCRFHTRCPEVIPPEEVDLEQAVWRNLLQFRLRAEAGGIDLDSVAEVGALEADGYDDVDTPTAETVDNADLKRWIRDEFDLPDQLSDSQAEAVLDDALDTLVAGDYDPDADTVSESIVKLQETFGTVCERATPELEQRGPDHLAACHLETDTRNIPDETVLND